MVKGKTSHGLLNYFHAPIEHLDKSAVCERVTGIIKFIDNVRPLTKSESGVQRCMTWKTAPIKWNEVDSKISARKRDSETLTRFSRPLKQAPISFPIHSYLWNCVHDGFGMYRSRQLLASTLVCQHLHKQLHQFYPTSTSKQWRLRVSSGMLNFHHLLTHFMRSILLTNLQCDNLVPSSTQHCLFTAACLDLNHKVCTILHIYRCNSDNDEQKISPKYDRLINLWHALTMCVAINYIFLFFNAHQH